MKILMILLLLLTCNALIINADKQYRCYHVNATFGEPVGLRGIITMILSYQRCNGAFCNSGSHLRMW